MGGNELASALRAEYLQVKAIQAALRIIMEGNAENWKMEYIGKRRELSIAFGSLSNIAKQLLPHVFDNTVTTDFQRAFSQLRHTTALHQADWPVVTIEASKSQYLQSLRNLENVGADFHAATDRLLRWTDINLANG